MNKCFPSCLMAFVVVTALFVSCTDNDENIDGGDFGKTPHIVKGKVEKGPLVRGSSVDMRPLDKNLVPTGESYTTTIENNTGDFNYGALKVSSPYAKLTAEGYFFNEVKGELSDGTIKLDAIVDLSACETVNVNVLTHLKSQRISYLVVSEGMSFRDANLQAQQELLSQFGLQEYSDKDVSQFSIISGDDAAAALIAVSSYILSDRSEAQIVEFLSKLSNEFALTGEFTPSTRETLRKTRSYLNSRLDKIAANIVARYKDLDYTVSVNDLSLYFDWDGDGVAGNEVEDTDNVTLSTNVLNVPKEGGAFSITINSDKSYYFEAPFENKDADTGLDVTPGGSITEENFYSSLYEGGYMPAFIDYTKEIASNIIQVNVSAAKFRKEQNTSFEIYNARGQVVATVTLIQEGDENIKVERPNLGQDGVSVVAGIALSLSNTLGHYSMWEQYLHYNQEANLVPAYVYPSASFVSNAWSSSYRTNNLIQSLKHVDERNLCVYQEDCNVWSAILYYYMVVAWGDVPYINTYNVEGNDNVSRTSASTILNELRQNLDEALLLAEDKKMNYSSDINDLFGMSKDVVRAMLANIYMYSGDYANAEALLKEITTMQHYSLDADTYNAMIPAMGTSTSISTLSDSETILGFMPQSLTTRSSITLFTPMEVPILTFSDVILSYAECLYKNGKTTEAKETLDSYIDKKNLVVEYDDFIDGLTHARLSSTLYTLSNIAYMKRNGIMEAEYGIDGRYTLLPIPQSELNNNPSMTQNPGY